MNGHDDNHSVWCRILAEAEEAIESEPFLAAVIGESVTVRSNLTEAICHRVASLLVPREEEQLLLTAITLLTDGNSAILARAHTDIMAVLYRDPATTKALHVLLSLKGFLALQAHRIAHALWLAGRRDLALYLQGCTSRALQVDVHPAARLGAGIFLDHAAGIVIGETCVVEDDVSILQNVTLGGTGKETGDRHPKVRRCVLIGAGATILGNIEIAANARIGAGSVVVKPVREGETVAGVPARVLGANLNPPAQSLDHVFESGPPFYDFGV